MSVRSILAATIIALSLVGSARSQEQRVLQELLLYSSEDLQFPDFVFSDEILDHEITETLKIRHFLFGLAYVPDPAPYFTELLSASNTPESFIDAVEEISAKRHPSVIFSVTNAQALALGRMEFIENSLQRNPNYTEGRLSRAPIAEKRRRAGVSFDHVLRAILRDDSEALTSSGLTEFVEFNPLLVELYLLHPDMMNSFGGAISIEMMGYLRRAQDIVALRAEEEALRAEEEALRAEEEALRAEEERLRAEEEALRAEEEALRAEEERLRAEEERLKAEGERLQEQNRLLFLEFREKVLRARDELNSSQ